MIISNQLYSPQAYLELVTGNCYIIHEGTATEIEKILSRCGLELLNCPINEVTHLDKNEIDVVLVECVDSSAPYIQELRWFEVPREEV